MNAAEEMREKAAQAAQEINRRNRARNHVLVARDGSKADVMPTDEMVDIIWTAIRSLSLPESTPLDGQLHGQESWEKVWELLEPWREVWHGDRTKFTTEYPAWVVSAAEELFAHDMCDAWNWNDYVKAACVIIARHLAALPESTEPGWISVEERLPPPMEGSLMSEEYLVGCGPSGDYDYFVARYNHNRKCWDDGNYQDDIPGVTHWRELPSPPAKPASIKECEDCKQGKPIIVRDGAIGHEWHGNNLARCLTVEAYASGRKGR